MEMHLTSFQVGMKAGEMFVDWVKRSATQPVTPTPSDVPHVELQKLRIDFYLFWSLCKGSFLVLTRVAFLPQAWL